MKKMLMVWGAAVALVLGLAAVSGADNLRTSVWVEIAFIESGHDPSLFVSGSNVYRIGDELFLGAWLYDDQGVYLHQEDAGGNTISEEFLVNNPQYAFLDDAEFLPSDRLLEIYQAQAGVAWGGPGSTPLSAWAIGPEAGFGPAPFALSYESELFELWVFGLNSGDFHLSPGVAGADGLFFEFNVTKAETARAGFPTPEPASMLLVGSGLMGFAASGIRKKSIMRSVS